MWSRRMNKKRRKKFSESRYLTQGEKKWCISLLSQNFDADEWVEMIITLQVQLKRDVYAHQKQHFLGTDGISVMFSFSSKSEETLTLQTHYIVFCIVSNSKQCDTFCWWGPLLTDSLTRHSVGSLHIFRQCFFSL